MKSIEQRLKHFRDENRRDQVETERNKIRKSLLYEINLRALMEPFDLIDCPQLTHDPIKYILQYRYAKLVNPVVMTGTNGKPVWKIPLNIYTSFWKYVVLIWDDLDGDSINQLKNFTFDFIKNYTAWFLHDYSKLESKLYNVFSSIATHLNRLQKNNLLSWLRGMEALDVMESLIDWANPPSRETYKHVYIAIEVGLLSQVQKFEEAAAKVMVRILKYAEPSQAYEFEMKQPKVGQQLNFALRTFMMLEHEGLWLALYYILQSDDQILFNYAPHVITTCTIMMNRITPNLIFGALQLLQLMSDYKNSIIWELMMGQNLMPIWLLNSDKHKITDLCGMSFTRSYYLILRNLILGANQNQLQQVCEKYILGRDGIPERMFRGIFQKQKDEESRVYVLDAIHRMVYGDEGSTSWEEPLEAKFQETSISKIIKRIIENSKEKQYQLSFQIDQKLSKLQYKRLEAAMKEIQLKNYSQATSQVGIKKDRRKEQEQKQKRNLQEKKIKYQWAEMTKEMEIKKKRKQQEEKAKQKIQMKLEIMKADEISQLMKKDERTKDTNVKEKEPQIQIKQKASEKIGKEKKQLIQKTGKNEEGKRGKEKKPRQKKTKTDESKRHEK